MNWEKIDNGNYVRIDELTGFAGLKGRGSPLAICTRQIGFGGNQTYVVMLIKYTDGIAGDDGVEILFESKNDENRPSHEWADSSYLKSQALKFATAKRKEYLNLLRYFEVAKCVSQIYSPDYRDNDKIMRMEGF